MVEIPSATPGLAAAPGAAPTATLAVDGDRPFVPAESIDTINKRLNVTLDGETTYIRNGGRVELGDGSAVEFYIDPYPPTALHSTMDIYLTHDGEPIPDASVDVEFDMLAMLHGPFISAAKDIGGGHHLVTLDYIMFGAWDQLVTIRIGLERIRIPVVIVATP